MIDWKKEYKRLLISTTVATIVAIFCTAIIINQTLKIKEQDNKISEQQIEITDLKEQIHMLEIK